jgi:hypothetical protein
MTLREFREKTKGLDQNLVLLSLYGEWGLYSPIHRLAQTNFITSKVDDEFGTTFDGPLDEGFAEENDVKLEDLETTGAILLS